MKIFKSFLFVLLCILVFGIVNFVFVKLLNWTIDRTFIWYKALDIFYFLLIAPFFWGTVWGIFKLSAIGLAALFIPVSPQRNFSIYSIMTLSAINAIIILIYYWTRDINFSWKALLLKTIISVFIVDFSLSIVLVFSKKENLAVEKM
jgi:hypothetical protein